jgi:hypothetical protein
MQQSYLLKSNLIRSLRTLTLYNRDYAMWVCIISLGLLRIPHIRQAISTSPRSRGEKNLLCHSHERNKTKNVKEVVDDVNFCLLHAIFSIPFFKHQLKQTVTSCRVVVDVVVIEVDDVVVVETSFFMNCLVKF